MAIKNTRMRENSQGLGQVAAMSLSRGVVKVVPLMKILSASFLECLLNTSEKVSLRLMFTSPSPPAS